ncbi:MAG: hypothetical protein ACOCYG_05155 [Spirochaetota bacterium]
MSAPIRTEACVTRIRSMLENEALSFSSDAGWMTLKGHVDAHRRILEQTHGIEVTWDDALYSWYGNVFLPVYQVASSPGFRAAFPGKPQGDLYLALSDHFHYLRQRDPSLYAADAGRSFVKHYGTGLSRYFSRFLLPY